MQKKLFYLSIFVFLGVFMFAYKTSNQDFFEYPEISLNDIIKTEETKATDIIRSFLPENQNKEALVKTRDINDIQFTSQAPFGEWNDPRQQDACEETVVIMAMFFVQDKEMDASAAKNEILNLSHWQEKEHGIFVDTSAQSTLDWLIKEYYDYHKAFLINDASLNDIKQELANGNIVIAPTNGRLLNNSYFSPPGPERHALLIKAYDAKTREFITNDPGTKRGENFRYDENVLFGAIQDYPSGDHLPIQKLEKNIIIIQIE